MEQTLMIVVGILCLPLVALGLRSMFMPKNMGAAVGISPQGLSGLSTIRSVLGGLFFACVAMVLLGVFSQTTLWFLAVAIVMAAVAVGRIVGLAVDGFDAAVIPPLVIELVIGGTLAIVHIVLSAV